jgi:hypothetical protein
MKRTVPVPGAVFLLALGVAFKKVNAQLLTLNVQVLNP